MIHFYFELWLIVDWVRNWSYSPVLETEFVTEPKELRMPHDKAKIWFFTDIHGSNRCFRKFLNLVQHENRPNVLIIGGDITGKQIAPLVHNDTGGFYTPLDRSNTLPVSELPSIKKALSDVGFYPYECDEQSHSQLVYDPNRFRSVFEQLTRDRLEEWIRLADEKLPESAVCQVFINAGNDDPLFVDEILDRSAKLIRPEGRVIDLPAGLKLLSMGYTNITPWKCPRDVSEDQLRQRISNMTGSLTAGDRNKVVFNFHCPPKDTALDLADQIDPETLKPIPGLRGSPKIHVGSVAVRQSIEMFKPLVSLHGHIHQVHSRDKIGSTLCLNPGSDYRSGRLQGVFLQINQHGDIEVDMLTQEREPAKTKENSAVVENLIHALPHFGHVYGVHQTHRRLDRIEEQLTKVNEKLDSQVQETNSATTQLPGQRS